MKLSGLAVLAALCISSAAYADTVQLGVSGVINNPAILSAGEQFQIGFTLAQDTRVTSLGLETYGFPFGAPAYGILSAALTGLGGAVSWSPGDILAAGSYTYTGTVLHCLSCMGINDYIGVNYYVPYTLIQDGGTLGPFSRYAGWGWDLVGSTVTSDVSPVPEPASLALVGSGVLAAFAGLRRRFA